MKGAGSIEFTANWWSWLRDYSDYGHVLQLWSYTKLNCTHLRTINLQQLAVLRVFCFTKSKLWSTLG